LAKLFPLNEKSGLNLMSHFSDNFTRYTTAPEAFEEAINKVKSELMETDKPEDQEIKLSNQYLYLFKKKIFLIDSNLAIILKCNANRL
jgi:hypothetical protein